MKRGLWGKGYRDGSEEGTVGNGDEGTVGKGIQGGQCGERDKRRGLWGKGCR